MGRTLHRSARMTSMPNNSLAQHSPYPEQTIRGGNAVIPWKRKFIPSDFLFCLISICNCKRRLRLTNSILCSWLYRIRPSVSHTPFKKIDNGGVDTVSVRHIRFL